MDQETQIADDSIRFAGADGHNVSEPRAQLEADMHWLIDRKVAEGSLTPERGMQAFGMMAGWLNASQTVKGHHINMAVVRPPQ